MSLAGSMRCRVSRRRGGGGVWTMIAAMSLAALAAARRSMSSPALAGVWPRVLLAAVALALLVSRGDAHHVAWVDLALCGAVWAVAFSASIHLVRSAIARQRSALWGLVGLGSGHTRTVPSAEVGCAACRSLPGGLTTSQSIGLFVLTGLLFGGLLTWAMQRSIAVADGSRTALAAIAVVAAVGPALYLTCTPFSVGSLVGLAAGVLGGALASAVGARVAMRAS